MTFSGAAHVIEFFAAHVIEFFELCLISPFLLPRLSRSIAGTEMRMSAPAMWKLVAYLWRPNSVHAPPLCVRNKTVRGPAARDPTGPLYCTHMSRAQIGPMLLCSTLSVDGGQSLVAKHAYEQPFCVREPSLGGPISVCPHRFVKGGPSPSGPIVQ